MIDKYIKNWIIKAVHDLENVRIIFLQDETKKKELADIICFHCQQAVEKLLKVYLVFKNIKFSKTHDLYLLLEQYKNVEDDFKIIDLGNLNNYSIEIRYPDDFYLPSLEETEDAYNKTLKIKNIVFNKLNINSNDIT